MALLSSLLASLRTFRGHQTGNIALNFAIVAPVLMGFVGVAVDMASLNQSKAQLQSVADSAALAAAREMRLGN
jgi:Flp pilus assembly protein TadG